MKGDIEMDSEIWSRLPEELLMLVLANVPTLINAGRFKAVCKRWKCFLSPSQTFQQISLTVPPCSSPAFIFGGKSYVRGRSVVEIDLYLLQSVPTSHTYKLSLDFLPSVTIVASSKSILLCRSSRVYRTHSSRPTSFYICNPVTRSWRKLPNPAEPGNWTFMGMAFDTSTRRCILVKGRNDIMEDKNIMFMEMYDSDTNRWTKLKMINIPSSISPTGQGIYSRGKFYWINRITVRDQIWCTRNRFDVAAFNVGQSSWDFIRGPERPEKSDPEFLGYWCLTGYDGKVVLVHKKDLCLWKLNEKEYRWSEFQAFPRSLYEEAASLENIVMVNSHGCILVHLLFNKYKLIAFDTEGRVIRSVQSSEHSRARPYVYEINNVYWP